MSSPLSVIALEPWLGGSHERFLRSWSERSRHDLRIVGLPARHWKWRMQSATWALTRELDGPPPDLIWVSDYLDLSRLRAFLPPGWRAVPTLAYFHENQLSYPLQPGQEAEQRDYTFGFANILTYLTADAVIFNSRFHLEEFATCAEELLRILPKPCPRTELSDCLDRAHVIAPGIEVDEIPLGDGPGEEAALRLAFNHRWEHDKDPRAFLLAVLEAQKQGAAVELVLLGESYAQLPTGTSELLETLRPSVLHHGYCDSREQYASLLGGCDLVLSTARHEFFGMAALEGLAAGCSPLLPDRLAYPEVLPESWHSQGLYATDAELARRIFELSQQKHSCRIKSTRVACRKLAMPFDARATASRMDSLCDELRASLI